ncbi:MAG TPA: hypothetical protein VE990_14255 [Acidimicrobiales bacterium]|nr:hypothetical protein [Acidimicrobiales bacterium]
MTRLGRSGDKLAWWESRQYPHKLVDLWMDSGVKVGWCHARHPWTSPQVTLYGIAQGLWASLDPLSRQTAKPNWRALEREQVRCFRTLSQLTDTGWVEAADAYEAGRPLPWAGDDGPDEEATGGRRAAVDHLIDTLMQGRVV